MTDEVWITLSDEDVQRATAEGEARTAFARSKGYQHRGQPPGWKHPRGDVVVAVDGACGEMAVARYLSLPFRSTVGIITANDVEVAPGFGVEVRTTAFATPDGRYGNLRLHRHSKRLPHVLALGRPPTFRLVGWIDRDDGLRVGREGPFYATTAIYVAQADLHPMPILLARVRCIGELYEDLRAKGYAA